MGPRFSEKYDDACPRASTSWYWVCNIPGAPNVLNYFHLLSLDHGQVHPSGGSMVIAGGRSGPRCLEDQGNLFETSPPTNDATGVTRYSTNIAIYTNIRVRVLVSTNLFLFFYLQILGIEKISPTSNLF